MAGLGFAHQERGHRRPSLAVPCPRHRQSAPHHIPILWNFPGEEDLEAVQASWLPTNSHWFVLAEIAWTDTSHYDHGVFILVLVRKTLLGLKPEAGGSNRQFPPFLKQMEKKN